jgi:transcription elongation GreA/GreB family factor
LLSQIDKKALLASIRRRISAQLEGILASQRATQEGAVHEETRAEGAKDTRATEASYLARGLAERAESLRSGLERLDSFVPVLLDGKEPARPGALVRVVEEGRRDAVYFILPMGGGESVALAGKTIRVISPLSPIGRMLMGREPGDEFTIDLPRGETLFTVQDIS